MNPSMNSQVTNSARRERMSALLGMLAIVSSCGTAAQAATVNVNPSQDTSIYNEGDASNALGALYAGATAGAQLRRALMEFDIAGSGIPAGSTINSVTLSLTLTKIGPAGAAPFELHPLLSSWGEGTSFGTGQGSAATPLDATWNYRFYNTNLWTTAGGDVGATSGTANIGSAAGTAYTFASQPGLVANVQTWLDFPGSNFGWILRAADETPSNVSARAFGSRESVPAQRPTLTVNYTPTPEPGTFSLLAAAGLAAFAQRRRSA